MCEQSYNHYHTHQEHQRVVPRQKKSEDAKPLHHAVCADHDHITSVQEGEHTGEGEVVFDLHQHGSGCDHGQSTEVMVDPSAFFSFSLPMENIFDAHHHHNHGSHDHNHDHHDHKDEHEHGHCKGCHKDIEEGEIYCKDCKAQKY